MSIEKESCQIIVCRKESCGRSGVSYIFFFTERSLLLFTHSCVRMREILVLCISLLRVIAENRKSGALEEVGDDHDKVLRKTLSFYFT